MIKVTLENGEVKEFDAPLSAFDAARELGEAKTACAAEIDGKVCDLRTTLTDGCTVKFLTFDTEQGQRAFNHTASHILAQASDGIRRSPLGESATLPTFGPSGRQERLNCWAKNLL